MFEPVEKFYKNLFKPNRRYTWDRYFNRLK